MEVAQCAPAAKIADVATDESLAHESVKQMDGGSVDFVLKCTKGLFAGRFIYANRTDAGEIFGSDKDAADITMYIENADLAPRHAEIRFMERTFQYFLKDLGSENGTWVKIRWNRSIEIAAGQELLMGDCAVRVEDGPTVPVDSEVENWLQMYQIDDTSLPNLCQTMGIRSFADLRSRASELQAAVNDPTESAGLERALAEFDTMFPNGTPPHGLSFTRPDGKSFSVTWRGATVAFAPESLADDAATQELFSVDQVQQRMYLPAEGWAEPELFRVGWSYGRYFMHLSERCAWSTQYCFVRLRDGQSHCLHPEDVFRIGSVEFSVLRYNIGICAEQGYRQSMEDEEVVIQDLGTSNYRHCSFFGVFDGHGGRECATFVKTRLHMNLICGIMARGGLDRSSKVHHDVMESLSEAYKKTDDQFMASAQNGCSTGAGCAGVCVMIVGGWIWCSNCGDSRAVLSRGGVAVDLSRDHKPDREDETARIEAAGGFVSFRRVLGRLAVSRAFGDQEYKIMPEGQKPLVIVDPEIRHERLQPEDEFIIIACDGLFDVFSSQEAVDFARNSLRKMQPNEQDPQKVVEEMVREAIEQRHSRDNVTAVLICFRRAVGS
mmetsp:Transcript_82524/g.220572  ORF Transcript_82524/g.220572 Transcript_82524/m.220572 type:complete len:606 (-) Transcript_82524:82-1899(-)